MPLLDPSQVGLAITGNGKPGLFEDRGELGEVAVVVARRRGERDALGDR